MFVFAAILQRNGQEEKDDIRLAIAGDQGAYKRLYLRHVDALFHFMMQFSDDRETVRDWVQQAFIRAFSKLDQFEGRSGFKTWLYQIAINEMRQSLRGLTFDKVSIDDHPHLEQEEVEISDWISLRDRIRQLPERQRLVLLMHDVEGFSHSEIAITLGINESSSRAILSRTKHQLREGIQS
jgi:RNA polymerase sigma-70 factor (ECF subfamily)